MEKVGSQLSFNLIESQNDKFIELVLKRLPTRQPFISQQI